MSGTGSSRSTSSTAVATKPTKLVTTAELTTPPTKVTTTPKPPSLESMKRTLARYSGTPEGQEAIVQAAYAIMQRKKAEAEAQEATMRHTETERIQEAQREAEARSRIESKVVARKRLEAQEAAARQKALEAHARQSLIDDAEDRSDIVAYYSAADPARTLRVLQPVARLIRSTAQSLRPPERLAS